MSKPYRKPTQPYIKQADCPRLYELEKTARQAFEKAARCLGDYLGLDDFWRETLPEAMATFLGSYEREAANLAAVHHLERQGYIVTPPKEETTP